MFYFTCDRSLIHGCLLFTFSNDVMAYGVAECHNGHLFCVKCAVTWVAKDIGMRPLKWSKAIHQALRWSRFKCCICRVQGPMSRSTATDAAVAALPVQCGYTALGLACLWTGRRDLFDSHQHSFADPAQHQQQPSGRGTKRPNSCNAGGQPAKQRRYHQTTPGNEESEDEVEFGRVQTARSDVVPGSAFPDINASGESVQGLVLETAIPPVNRTGIMLAADAAAAAAAGNDGEEEEEEEEEENAGPPDDDLHISQEEPQTAGEIGVRDGGGNSSGITLDADWEQESRLTDTEAQLPWAPPAVSADGGAAAVVLTANERAAERYVIYGQFDAVHNALQNAGLIAKPTIPPVDKLAKLIYNATARAVRWLCG